MSSGKKMRQADIKSELQTITRNFNEFFGYLGLASGVKGKSIAQLFNIKADSGCLSALYNFLLQVQYSDTLSKLYGIYGETLGEMANYKIGETANEAVEEAIKDVIGKKGCESSTFEKSTSLASQAAISAMTKSELSMFKAYTTKNKVDATITLQDELGIERDVEASIKAYSVRQGNSYYTPHLEDVDLYSALAATEANFGNHWLNLHVSGGRSFMGDVAQPMDDAFKEQVAYQALASGNLLKTDASIANTFISIDVTSGEVFVKTAADMLKNELNNFNFYPKNFHSIENIVFSNKREESWQRRIAVLLTEINSIKIYTTYKVLLSSNSK
jgi:hypothetical protein